MHCHKIPILFSYLTTDVNKGETSMYNGSRSSTVLTGKGNLLHVYETLSDAHDETAHMIFCMRQTTISSYVIIFIRRKGSTYFLLFYLP